MKALRALIEGLSYGLIRGGLTVKVRGVAYDSRVVERGDLFVCLRGSRFDGHAFVTEAYQRGARCFVVEREPTEVDQLTEVTVVRVPETRAVIPTIADRFYGHPSGELTLVGVTGTNGKTTTTYLIEAVLREGGELVGLVGTIAYRCGDQVRPADRTTPEAPDLQRLLREMRDAGATGAVLEVSSHALALGRVEGCEFDVAVFTNLTQDHLDFHGDLEGYFQAKARLFTGLAGPRTKARAPVAVLNQDDPTVERFQSVVRGRVLTYGTGSTAMVRAEAAAVSAAGIRARVVTPSGPFEIVSDLVGRHNLSNLLAAAATGIALEIPPDRIAAGLARGEPVPGRFERIKAGQPFTVVVDYAHTPDALGRVLQTARELTQGQLVVVVGCGGDRDRGKRPLMGEVAARLADLAVLTSDNPRSEDPEQILAQTAAGARQTGRPTVCLVDRREAIHEALRRAGPGDLVLIAGKGHEQYQIIGDQAFPFDDREVARAALAQLGYRADCL